MSLQEPPQYRVWRVVKTEEGERVTRVEDVTSLPSRMDDPSYRWWKSALLCALDEDGVDGCDGPCEPGSPCEACREFGPAWWFRWEDRYGRQVPLFAREAG